jgi:outer membrane protein assembly factor BamA
VGVKSKTLLAACAVLGLAATATAAPRPFQSQPSQQQAPAQAATQTPAGTGTLAAATATGSSKFTSEQIIAAGGLKVGEPVTREDLQTAANRLAATGLFSSVHYKFASGEKGITVEFQVADAATVPVTFDNFPWFTDKELTEAIRQAVGIFDGTAPEQGSYVDSIGVAIENQLTKIGVQGRVEHRLIERLVGNGMELQFRLVGPQLIVGSVEFTDQLAQHDARVQQRLQDIVGKPFSRYYINVFLTEQVRPIYLSQGYVQVEFDPPEARFSGDPNRPDLGRVLVVVPVHPGKAYHWGGASWVGNTVFNATTLDALLGLQDGQAADGLAIHAAWEKVRQQYGSKGYLDAELDPEPSFDAAKSVVTYQVKVTEGVSYKMGKLVISGLSVEAENRVRKAWLIRRGQVFDHSYYEAFLDDIAPKALADLPVHYQHIGRFLQKDEKHETVDVLLDFR